MSNDHLEFIRKFDLTNFLALKQIDNLLVLNLKALHSEGITTAYLMSFSGIIINQQIICTVNRFKSREN